MPRRTKRPFASAAASAAAVSSLQTSMRMSALPSATAATRTAIGPSKVVDAQPNPSSTMRRANAV